jgi:hypothetical protein
MVAAVGRPFESPEAAAGMAVTGAPQDRLSPDITGLDAIRSQSATRRRKLL